MATRSGKSSRDDDDDDEKTSLAGDSELQSECKVRQAGVTDLGAVRFSAHRQQYGAGEARVGDDQRHALVDVLKHVVQEFGRSLDLVLLRLSVLGPQPILVAGEPESILRDDAHAGAIVVVGRSLGRPLAAPLAVLLPRRLVDQLELEHGVGLGEPIAEITWTFELLWMLGIRIGHGSAGRRIDISRTSKSEWNSAGGKIVIF